MKRINTLIPITVVLSLFLTNVFSQCTNQLGEWQKRSDIPEVHMEGASATLGDKLYLITGFKTEKSAIRPINTGGLVAIDRLDIYDPVKDEWTTGANCPIKASHVQAAAWVKSPSGKARFIFIAGGFIGDHPGNVSDQVWRYDTITDKWKEIQSLPEARASGGLVIDQSHMLHYIGGLKDRNVDASDHWVLDLMDPDAAWESRANFTEERNHFQATCIGDVIYVTGGQRNHDAAPIDTNLTSAYNISTDEWIPRADLPTPRTHEEPNTIVVNNRVVLFGGRNNQGPGPVVLNTIVEYDPVADKWAYLRNLPRQSYELTAGFFRSIEINGTKGDYIVITAGGTDWNAPARDTWITKVTCSCCVKPDDFNPEFSDDLRESSHGCSRRMVKSASIMLILVLSFAGVF